ncbi:MAG: alkaline phosphatase family protein [Planctomycetes bacterium]|nr:alkaline phosphatase family protein [Planctomycetota bacterium]
MSIALAAVLSMCAPQEPVPTAAVPAIVQGPFLGAADADSIWIWARATQPGRYAFALWSADGKDLPRATAEASPDHELTLQWHLTGLRGRRGPFGYRITRGERTIGSADFGVLTPAIDDAVERSVVAFGSCAEERKGPQPVWGQIIAAQPDALVLLGDTPYIDSTRLDVQRRRRAEFFAHPDVAMALRVLSTYATWDDHDYATNDRFGDLDDRENSRRAFLEHHALGPVGHDDQGIYTRFRRGPLEVFVLDTRWFADQEPCPFAPTQKSLLGTRQLAWLQQGLRASTAPFKVLACGMAWNGAVRTGKLDCWANWAHERDGLLRWCGEHRIGGIVLVGGDLHVTRLIRHATKELCGYDVLEVVTSPLANDPIPANAGKIDGVLFDAAAPATFLLAEAAIADDGPRLHLRFRDAAGKELHTHVATLLDLSAAK